MEEPKTIKDWYLNFKENQLEKDIKRCKTFTYVSGTVASLSALVLAGNLVVGNGLEAFQLGGSTAAMLAYSIGYANMESIYKKEQTSFKERLANPKSFTKTRLEELKYELDILKSQLSMDYIVAGSFYATTLGHLIELLSLPEPPEMVANITGAALSGLVATLYLKLSKNHRIDKKGKELETENLEKIAKLEEESKAKTPGFFEAQDVIEINIPEEPEASKIRQLERTTKK